MSRVPPGLAGRRSGAPACAAPLPARRILRLYVAAGAPNSEAARSKLGALCSARLLDEYQIEVVDVMREPARAAADGVRMTPTLLHLAPCGVMSIVGPLANGQQVLAALDLAGEME